MSLLIPVLRAAHCRSTHHFFAVDALDRVGSVRGKLLCGVLLKHYRQYLTGAKAPDDTFKDFQNHVLHVSDNYWGGAPKTCEQWLEKTHDLLDSGQWSEAAYACGVLSHYFTDPIMPLHTGQTDRESVVHRPMEWSICKAYNEIYDLCLFQRTSQPITLDSGDQWISKAVRTAATVAHAQYDRLIEIYNLARGVVDPPRGLTKEARQILADLFDMAVGGWASVLARIANDSTAAIPDASLDMATLIACIDVPRAAIIKKFADVSERAAVQRLFDEYASTGSVRINLPEEIKVVKLEKVKERELAEATLAKVSNTPSPPVSKSSPETRKGSPREFDAPPTVPRRVLESVEVPASPTVPVAEPVVAIVPTRTDKPAVGLPAPHEITPTPHQALEPITSPRREALESGIDSVPTLPAPAPKSGKRLERVAENVELNEAKSAVAPSDANETEPQHDGLPLDAPLADAPSIGPKTAKRFAEIGVESIEDFLRADAHEMAQALDTAWIKPALIEEWQSQTRLVVEVPALCGYKAQLLVAIGCRTPEQLASADVSELYSVVAAFCKTKDSVRILRSSPAPTMEEIERWIDSAQILHRAATAAGKTPRT